MKPRVVMHPHASPALSVLSVEPYGMKLYGSGRLRLLDFSFSALGRAVWDETGIPMDVEAMEAELSVLSVEPYGMKHLQLLDMTV